jgi:mono/diheme cytochrome c family protein
MDELLQIIADQKGYSTEMVERSAAARAKADGVSVEDVLRAWAGGEAPPAAGAAPSADAAPAPPAPAATTAPESEPEDTGPAVEVLGPATETQTADEAPEPPDTEGEAVKDEEVPVGAGAGFPRWLAAAFIVLPSLALLYVMVLPSGPQCGSAGALGVDPSTGVAENCDGSEYGSDANDVFAVGNDLYAGNCASCHGANGGGGTGPAFTNGAVLATFGACTDHVEWVAIGTANWPDATYGDTAKPVGGGGQMPGYENTFTPEEIAAVVLYERVAFGGEDRAESEAGCFPEAEVTAAP